VLGPLQDGFADEAGAGVRWRGRLEEAAVATA